MTSRLNLIQPDDGKDTEVVVAAGIPGVLVAAEKAVAEAGTQPLVVVVVLMAQDMGFHIHCTLCMLFGLFWTMFGFYWNLLLLLELMVWLRRGCSVR
ncbi:hypothetical protein SO802_033355 [Lithocarpus litseifolius]|uniref:Uncharacterized protein n=1 Tax=Lithocarpus litseifolius TaxID=425828 RepID=A0AAW2BG27_9ROSI